jgi:hypothetical protein
MGSGQVFHFQQKRRGKVIGAAALAVVVSFNPLSLISNLGET